MPRLALFLLLSTCVVGCRNAPGPTSPIVTSSGSAAYEQGRRGVADPVLADLLGDHWDWTMRLAPVWATTLGDHRFDDRISDNSAEGLAAARAARRDFLARAQGIPAGSLTAADETTRRLFVEMLQASIDGEACHEEEWVVSVGVGSNPVSRWNVLPEQHKVVTPADAANYLARVRAIPGSIDNEIAHLRRGLADGRVSSKESMERVATLIRDEVQRPVRRSPLLAPWRASHPTWTDAETRAFKRDLWNAVSVDVRKAFGRYLALIETELLPRGRSGADIGVGALPGGAACYASQIRVFLGLTRTPQELHELGLAALRSNHDEFRAVGRRALGTDDVATIFEKLRTDPALRFQTSDEVEAKARVSLAAAKAKIAGFFGILPKSDCVVARVPDYEAKYTTIAYYRQPHADGTKPGEYYVNVSAPETRPRFEAATLAFHESIPGHHLQIAISQELAELPAFRRNMELTAFVEGWALYTERLADEMGLYADDLDRLGMLSFDAWRAARLVVDTGIHSKGWSREQAKEFMRKWTPLAENNIDVEVDRYIGWPGQALGYKVGQLEILRLRAEAEKALGARFDVKGFHDAVLGAGAVTLPILGDRVREWVSGRAGFAHSPTLGP